MAGMVGYVRVSRVGGRAGERFLSPAEQRRRIAAWANLHGVEVIAVLEDLDVPGSRAPGERQLERALAMCEAGDALGVIVHRLDRFSRSAVDTLVAARRLKDAGARLVGVDDGVDTATAGGQLILTILAALAEQQLDRVREGWDAAVGAAVARGVHVGPTPFGYVRRDDGRLEPDEATAPLVGEAFRLVAAGRSWQEVADAVGLSRMGVRGLIASRTYLGEARSGAHVRRDAHPALVTQAEWDAANAGRRRAKPRHDRSLTSQVRLQGLVICGACGHNLVVTGSGPPEKRRATYYCRARFASGDCPAPAAVAGHVLDGHVIAEARRALKAGELDALLRPGERLAAAQEAVDEAEAELSAFLEAGLVSVLGAETYRAEVERRQAAVDAARRTWSDLLRAVETVAVRAGRPLTRAQVSASLDDDREALRALVGRVEVDRADPTRRRWQPVAERVRITWRAA